MRLSNAVLLLVSMFGSQLIAQGRPAGSPERLWISAGLNAGRQEFRCGGCLRGRTMGTVGFTASTGVTLPRDLGVAFAVHRITEYSFEYSQQSQYVFALGQYAIPGASALSINAGVGAGRYWGDTSPYIHHGSGATGTAGVALRFPAGSLAALSLSASYIGAFTGTRERDPSGTERLLKPRLLLVSGSLSLATIAVGPRAPRGNSFR